MEDELTPEQLQALERDLRRLAAELEEGLERSAEAEQPVDLDEPIGRVSRIDAIAQREIQQAGRREQTRRLEQVRSALMALERGDYGLCRVCDEPIGHRRLKAQPYAVICLTCQAQRERERMKRAAVSMRGSSEIGAIVSAPRVTARVRSDTDAPDPRPFPVPSNSTTCGTCW